jgi:hypothetical protein
MCYQAAIASARGDEATLTKSLFISLEDATDKEDLQKGVLFIGVFIPTRRGLDIQTNLSLNRLQIVAD